MSETYILPDLLFVTPVAPQLTGLGIAMRAGAHVEVLSRFFRVTLALAAPGGKELVSAMPAEIAVRCGDVFADTAVSSIETWLRMLPGQRGGELAKLAYPMPVEVARHRAAVAGLAKQLAGRRFDTVFCFRLHTAGFLGAMQSHGISARRSVLDLDDYESRTRHRNAWTLRRSTGRQVMLTGLADALKLRLYERVMIPRFDVATVCSESDRAALSQRFRGCRFEVLPNVVRPPQAVERKPHAAFTFLFLGAMGYEPNADAARYFCTEVLPILRRLARRPFRLLIAGRMSDLVLASLAAQHSEVTVLGEVADVADCYAAANAVVVPLRTGGGTRIKIVEAFAYGVPVVSTPIGAEGLGAEDGRHLLLAADADAFARRCQQLIEDAALAAGLAGGGRLLWSERYTIDALGRQVWRACFDERS